MTLGEGFFKCFQKQLYFGRSLRYLSGNQTFVAADRAHRIGQENPVLIHRLIAKDTIEERVLELQKKKAQLAASVLQGSGAAVNRV